ncbi:MAG TPA: tetratricopeptide repeat protein [Opitutaceae bacterium]|nr:tetratricopeptide repeat protein [Opitutaceae bacterium]
MARSAARSPATAPPPRAAPAWAGRDRLFVLAVFAVVLLAYQPVWHAGFMWDDDSHLTNNPCIVGPLGFQDIWTSPAGYYFPLVTSSFWLMHAVWGLNPLAYHLISVLLHAASAVLLWQVLRRLRVRGAWLGALLWALHPVQVESVAWIAELKNTQSGLFYLLAIGCFLRWVGPSRSVDTRGSIHHYALALLCAVAAILSKSSTVMLPVVLGLCWWWTKDRWRWRQVLWLAPFLAVSAAAGAWTIWEQRFHSGALGPDWNQSGLERLIIAGRALWFYLGKLAWPHPLIFIYPRWTPDTAQLASYVPAAAAVAALVLLWWWRRHIRPVIFAAVYFGVSLFPVLGFFNVYFYRYSFVGDHFQYLASMGALALAGAGITTALARMGKRGAMLQPALCTLLLITLGGLTWRQSREYADESTLWEATLAENPACWIAHTNLGGLLVKAGRYSDAINHLREALRLHPGIDQAEYNLGLGLFKAGRAAEAIPHYEESLRLRANDADTISRIGDALVKLGRLPEAAARYEASLRLNPADPLAQNNLGVALLQLGRPAEALPHFREAVRLKPGYAEAQNNLGNVLVESGRTDEAIGHLQAAIKAEPGFADAHYNLAVVLLGTDRTEEGIAHLQQVVRLTPHDAGARALLGRTFLRLGRVSEAIPQLQEALQLDPSLTQARADLVVALRQLAAPASPAPKP